MKKGKFLFLLVSLFLSGNLFGHGEHSDPSLSEGVGVSDENNIDYAAYGNIVVQLEAPVETIVNVTDKCPSLFLENTSGEAIVTLKKFSEELLVFHVKVEFAGDQGNDGMEIENRTIPIVEWNNGIAIDIEKGDTVELNLCSLRKNLVRGLYKIRVNGSYDQQRVKSAKFRIGIVDPFSSDSRKRSTTLYSKYYKYDREQAIALLDFAASNPLLNPEEN